ncbi:hypothetical protein [Xenorhabdus sp. TS4]|nr:hypothetical protein [Xenorhabdus sp. TS4]
MTIVTIGVFDTGMHNDWSQREKHTGCSSRNWGRHWGLILYRLLAG